MIDHINGHKIKRRDHAPHTVGVSWAEGRDQHSMRVSFGLHYIRGNSAPYFSVTADGRTNGRESFGGCCHDIIAQRLPELSDIIELHLSDIDGVPMHAEANGWYQLAGVCGGFGERYHAGNVETYGRPRDCLGAFAAHCRVSREEAQKIADDVLAYDVEMRERLPWAERISGKCGRERWRAHCEAMRPRWKKEAGEVIARYGLTVYGDHWKPQA